MENSFVNVSQDKKNMAAIIHGAGLLFGFLPSLIMYFVKQDDPYLKRQSMEALNYQITVMILVLVSWVLVFVLIGLVLLPLIGLANFVLCIVAALKVSGGDDYRYPFALRLLKDKSDNQMAVHSPSASLDCIKVTKRLFCGGCGQSVESCDLFCPSCGSKQRA